MKLLIDNPLSPFIADELKKTNYDAIHVRDYDMQSASDEEIFDKAAIEDRILISADTDFGTLLALRGEKKPSIVLFKHPVKRPEFQLNLLLANLPFISKELDEGSIVVFEASRIRIRKLPIGEKRKEL